MAAVRRYDILDTPPDGAFDRIAATAAELFDVPIGMVSIVDTDRIWFKAHHGLAGVGEIGRYPGLRLGRPRAGTVGGDRRGHRSTDAGEPFGRREARAAVLHRRAADDERRAQSGHAVRLDHWPRPVSAAETRMR
jgi:hypothetical protein